MALVDDGHTVDDMLVVEPAPGHTRGHVRIRIRSRGREGIFSGDIIHHPVQVPFPQLCSMFDDDQQSALQTRLKLLGECADHDILLMPTHFAEPHCCRIVGRGASLESNGFERSTISTRMRGYVLAPSPARASCARRRSILLGRMRIAASEGNFSGVPGEAFRSHIPGLARRG